jgi:hypothetical protein
VELLIANATFHCLDDCGMGLRVIGVLSHPAQVWRVDQAIEMGVPNLKWLHQGSNFESSPVCKIRIF